jgi:hypothetical protein
MNKTEIFDAAASYLKSQAIQISQKSLTIRKLYRHQKENKLELKDWFQREYTWSHHQQVMLIHSVLNTPELIPELVLFLDTNGKYVVADGQQRLTTLFRFIDEKFPYELKDFRPTDPYYGTNSTKKDFEECCEEIMDTSLRTVIISNNNLDEEKVKILQSSVFNKWNSGSSLSDAEKRGAVLSDLNKIIKPLVSSMEDAEKEAFVQTKSFGKNKVNEMLEKMIFHYQSTLGFHRDPTPKELESEHNKHISEAKQNIIDKIIRTTIKAVYLYQTKNKNNFVCGIAPLRDILVASILLYRDKKIATFENLEKHIVTVMEILNNLYIDNEKFTAYRTGQTDKMDAEINEKWFKPYFSNLGKGQNNKAGHRVKFLYENYEKFMAHQQRDSNRIFPIDVQTKVWNKQEKKCATCHQEFALTDLQADHILEYSLGGLTSEENLQLLCVDCHKEKTKEFLKQKNLVESFN